VALFASDRFVGVTAGAFHTCALTLKDIDRVTCWGSNQDYQLGVRTSPESDRLIVSTDIFQGFRSSRSTPVTTTPAARPTGERPTAVGGTTTASWVMGPCARRPAPRVWRSPTPRGTEASPLTPPPPRRAIFPHMPDAATYPDPATRRRRPRQTAPLCAGEQPARAGASSRWEPSCSRFSSASHGSRPPRGPSSWASPVCSPASATRCSAWRGGVSSALARTRRHGGRRRDDLGDPLLRGVGPTGHLLYVVYLIARSRRRCTSARRRRGRRCSSTSRASGSSPASGQARARRAGRGARSRRRPWCSPVRGRGFGADAHPVRHQAAGRAEHAGTGGGRRPHGESAGRGAGRAGLPRASVNRTTARSRDGPSGPAPVPGPRGHGQQLAASAPGAAGCGPTRSRARRRADDRGHFAPAAAHRSRPRDDSEAAADVAAQLHARAQEAERQIAGRGAAGAAPWPGDRAGRASCLRDARGPPRPGVPRRRHPGAGPREIGKLVDAITTHRQPDRPARPERGDRSGARGPARLGFRVVADEVRKLAEQSARSRRRCGPVCRQTAGPDRQVIAAMDEGRRTAQAWAPSPRRPGRRWTPSSAT